MAHAQKDRTAAPAPGQLPRLAEIGDLPRLLKEPPEVVKEIVEQELLKPLYVTRRACGCSAQPKP